MNRTSYWGSDVGRGLCVSDAPVDREGGTFGNSASGASSSARGIEAVNEDKQQLAANIAHDLNNLMSVILGNCELVAREGVPLSSSGRLERIREAGERAVGLANELLTRKRAVE